MLTLRIKTRALGVIAKLSSLFILGPQCWIFTQGEKWSPVISSSCLGNSHFAPYRWKWSESPIRFVCDTLENPHQQDWFWDFLGWAGPSSPFSFSAAEADSSVRGQHATAREQRTPSGDASCACLFPLFYQGKPGPYPLPQIPMLKITQGRRLGERERLGRWGVEVWVGRWQIGRGQEAEWESFLPVRPSTQSVELWNEDWPGRWGPNTKLPPHTPNPFFFQSTCFSTEAVPGINRTHHFSEPGIPGRESWLSFSNSQPISGGRGGSLVQNSPLQDQQKKDVSIRWRESTECTSH